VSSPKARSFANASEPPLTCYNRFRRSLAGTITLAYIASAMRHISAAFAYNNRNVSVHGLALR
jgi:hypothetical protein